MSLRLAVFASGGGSNLQSLIDRLNAARAPWGRVSLVVSDRADAGALERAEKAGIPACVVRVSSSDPASLQQMLDVLDRERIDTIALAGYLRLVHSAIVERYRGRIVNIHPALLPTFGGHGMYGLNVHRAVLAAGCRVTGVTVHHVDERYDEGRVIAQWPVPVLSGDTPESLAARVLVVEHRLYPLALELLARGATARMPHAFGSADSIPDSDDMRRALGLNPPAD